MTELEIFAMIFAASIHDYEHTGTTNNFHIQTRYQVLFLPYIWKEFISPKLWMTQLILCYMSFIRSDTAILYNDRAVQENHHVSSAYRLLQEDDEMNILYNLSKDDWR